MKNLILKIFLYVLLFFVILSIHIAFGFFISMNANIFEWHMLARFIILILSVFVTLFLADLIERSYN